jgi:DNA-binding protein YbaB
VVDPQSWLADFEARVASAKAKAEQFSESLSSAGASATSSDGLVTVTVAPNGSLANLRISDAALRDRSGSQLSELVLRTARDAQRAAANRVLEAFTELGGADSEATKMLTGFVPPPEEPEPNAARPRRTADRAGDAEDSTVFRSDGW